MLHASRAALCAASLASISLFASSSSARGATIPSSYTIQLQLRAATGGTAFNAPNLSTFNSVSPNLNDAGNVAVKLNTISSSTAPGLWFGGHGNGSVVYNSNDNNAIMSDPYVNNNDQVSIPRSSSSVAANDGLYIYDNATATTTHPAGPLGATSYTNPAINDSGKINGRVKFSTPQALTSYDPVANTFTNYAIEGATYSFLYAPASNNNNKIAAQVNLTSAASTYKELRIWNPDGSSVLVASGDSSTGPNFFTFDNSISMNNNNQVAFSARTTSASSSKRIVVGDGTTTTLFPTVSSGSGFTSIDSFPPSINDGGLVAFRGNDNQASPKDSVFITDGVTFKKIAGVGDTVQTDLGARTISSLGGAVDINNNGEVAFAVTLNNGGNAIFVAYVPEPTSLGFFGAIGSLMLARRRAR